MDRTGRGNNGRIEGAQWSLSTPAGSALIFDGIDDWVTVENSIDLDVGSALTIVAWVRPVAPGDGAQTLAAKEGAGEIVYGLSIGDASAAPSAVLSVRDRVVALSGDAPVPAEAWSHLALTYTGRRMTLYLDAREIAFTIVPGSIDPSAGPLRIGGTLLEDSFFVGPIDEMRLYNRALTRQAIEEVMIETVPAEDEGEPRPNAVRDWSLYE